MVEITKFEFTRFKFGPGYEFKVTAINVNRARQTGYGRDVPSAWHDLMENIQIDLEDQEPEE